MNYLWSNDLCSGLIVSHCLYCFEGQTFKRTPCSISRYFYSITALNLYIYLFGCFYSLVMIFHLRNYYYGSHILWSFVFNCYPYNCYLFFLYDHKIFLWIKYLNYNLSFEQQLHEFQLYLQNSSSEWNPFLFLVSYY